jgi:hypothetical protein
MSDHERLIGHIGFDAGIVALGDPCYLIAGGGPNDPEWQDVVAQVFDDDNPRRVQGTSAVQVHGTIMTTTPSGDGAYPVYAELDDPGQVLALRVELRRDRA